MSRAGVRPGLALLAAAMVCVAASGGQARQLPSPSRAPGASASQVPATAASISGRVTDGSTGAPLPGAIVSLVVAVSATPQTGRQAADSQATDHTGRFLFAGVPATRAYHVLASKPGYFDGALGVDAAHATPRRVTLTEGQSLRDVTIPLWKPSAISGTIVDETGEPAVGVHVGVVAQVLVSGVPQFASGRFTRTDDRGAYRIAPLTPGTYAVMVPSIRFAVPTELPAAPASDRPQSISTLEEAVGFTAEGRLVLRLPSPALQLSPGQHALLLDDGHSLVLGYGSPLPPPPGADGRRQAYPPSFYASARSLVEAAQIELAPGEERLGIDLQLHPVPASRLSGVVEGPVDAIAERPLRLMSPGSEHMGPGHEVATAFTGPTGHFTFVDVPDGQYTIVTGRGTPSVGPVQPGGSGAIATTSLQTLATLTGGVTAVDRFFGRTPVAISGTDRGDVVVRLRQGVSMTGRIAIDTPEDLTALNQRGTRLQVAAEPAVAVSTLRAGVVSSVPLSATALDFTLAGLRPGDYVLRMYADSGTIKSIMWGGKDYAGLPITVADQDLPGLVITVTSQAPRLEGRVREADGAAAWAASVIYFPEDRSRWRQYGPQPDRLRSVPVRNGIFEIPKMPAGDYYLVAVDEGLADRWRDPAFLESAARVATRVAIGWGETRTQDLTVMEVTR